MSIRRTEPSCSFVFLFISISKHKQRAGLYKHFHTYQQPFIRASPHTPASSHTNIPTPASPHTSIHTHIGIQTYRHPDTSASIHISVQAPHQTPSNQIIHHQQHQATESQTQCPLRPLLSKMVLKRLENTPIPKATSTVVWK